MSSSKTRKPSDGGDPQFTISGRRQEKMNTRIKEQESLRNLKEVVPMLGAIERADGKKSKKFEIYDCAKDTIIALQRENQYKNEEIEDLRHQLEHTRHKAGADRMEYAAGLLKAKAATGHYRRSLRLCRQGCHNLPYSDVLFKPTEEAEDDMNHLVQDSMSRFICTQCLQRLDHEVEHFNQ